jgi:large subunit ribosomal protein L4
MQAAVYNQKGEKVGTVDLSDVVFGLKWNADLVHQVVTAYAANLRRGTAHTKGRGEVRGGGRKPWRQKGTGRARHGSIRSPLWKGGGVTHGPTSERIQKKKIPRKMAKKALYVVLSAKARGNEIIILDELRFVEPKTRLAANLFNKLSEIKEFGNLKKGNGVLIVLPGKDDAARRALRNLPYAGIAEARNLNAYGVMQYKYVLLPRAALEVFKQ